MLSSLSARFWPREVCLTSRSRVQRDILQIVPPSIIVKAETIDVRYAHLVTINGIWYVGLRPEGRSTAPKTLLDARVVHLRRV